MATKAELTQQAEALGIDTTDMTVKQLNAAIKDATPPEPISQVAKEACKKKHGDIENGTIYFDRPVNPGAHIAIDINKYVVLSETVARNNKTGEHFTITYE